MSKKKYNFYLISALTYFNKIDLDKDGKLSVWSDKAHRYYKTKTTKEDLPETYIHVYDYRKNGYIRTDGVSDIFYHASPFDNHTFKDDFIYLKYDGASIDATDSDTVYDTCDEFFWGNGVVDIIYAIEHNSPQMYDRVQEIKKIMVGQVNKYYKHEKEWGRDREMPEFETLDEYMEYWKIKS